MLTDNEKKPRRYAEVFKDYKNEEEIERQPEQPVSEERLAEISDLRKAPSAYIPSCVAWVRVPRGRVHIPVPSTRTGYLGTAMVRTQTYPRVP